ncbi:hypothetical protein P9738_13075 [Bacillus siamensis]|uniref:hypothetical protein n=1 Tax=Bacillus siamensis TaxID=659243 RepID=UPI002E1DFF00|nr:hypothetical protein [Bacillus siamensis]MED5097134.1 hypothetical protein [Bacillus siamensis]
MAKLNGVKTLDMVNGEITKVAYGGAVYERVEGIVRELGNPGDLMLNGRDHKDISVGEFYEVIVDGVYGRVTVSDDIGQHHRRATLHDSSVLFRKVSASTGPSLEERVSSAEDEIESLKSDVAALKGESEYVRIDVAEAQDGDYVKFDEAPRRYLTAGRYYEIDYVDSSGDPWITDDDGGDFDTSVLHDDEFEVYRKVSAASVEAEPKPERLNVGDYAKVVKDFRDHEVEIGTILLVTIIDDAAPSIKCDDISGNRIGWFFGHELVRATDEEVAEAKDAAARAKFKKGAKVRLLSGGGDYPLGGFTDGNIYEVSDNAYNHSRGTLIRIEGGSCFRGSGFATPDQLEILSEEEAAEIERQQAEEAKWAKIGRKVGEYKNGDVVAYDDPTWFKNSGIGEVVGLSAGEPRVRAIDSGGRSPAYYLEPEKVRLITPVEGRFDR